MRRPTGGDPGRKALNLHHGLVITNHFMEAVRDGTEWGLLSPKDGALIRNVSARELWTKILTTRVETGEPYMLFIDSVNSMRPVTYNKLGLDVKMSNLCSEIMLTTGRDHLNNCRTAVCCLSSLNLEKYDEWENDPRFVEDIMRFLDNVLEDFINKAPDSMYKAKYSAMRERSVGLGVMGFHSLLQKRMIPFESAAAKSLNKSIFVKIKKRVDDASVTIAQERGACPDAQDIGLLERFTHKIAIAPTASISIIANNASPGIEPYVANIFVQKTLTGSFTVCNRHLKALLVSKDKDTPEIWSSICTREGSVQHLDFLDKNEKDVFKTAYELDQRWLIEHAADRTPYVCQGQSLNIFLAADVHKYDLHMLHFLAWKKKIKSYIIVVPYLYSVLIKFHTTLRNVQLIIELIVRRKVIWGLIMMSVLLVSRACFL